MTTTEIKIGKEYNIDYKIARASLSPSHINILDRMVLSNPKHKVVVDNLMGGFCIVVGQQSDSKMGKLKIPRSCLYP